MTKATWHDTDPVARARQSSRAIYFIVALLFASSGMALFPVPRSAGEATIFMLGTIAYALLGGIGVVKYWNAARFRNRLLVVPLALLLIAGVPTLVLLGTGRLQVGYWTLPMMLLVLSVSPLVFWAGVQRIPGPYPSVLLAASLLVGTRLSIGVPIIGIILWPGFAVWWWHQLRSNTDRADADVRAGLSFQIGFVLTLLSLYRVVPNDKLDRDPPLQHLTPSAKVDWINGHPPFGGHPVTAYAGFPWAGVEGCPPHAWAMEKVPFDMGVDALLVNFACWSAAAFVLMRLPARIGQCILIVLVGLVAPLAVVEGWPPYGYQPARLPFEMDVGAFLVNFACWSGVACVLMRLSSRIRLYVLMVLVGLLTPFALFAGMRQLSIFFD